MNKIIPVLYFLYLLFISLVAQSLLFTINNGEIITSYGTITQGTTLEFVWGMIVFIFSMFTLQVEGIPAFVSIILFWVPTLAVVFVYILPMIRGN